MKKGTRFLCLLLIALFLFGCAPQGQTEDPVTAPDSSGAAVDFQEAVQTQQALAQIASLGESPDDNYRTWYEIFVYSFCDSDGDGIGDLNGVTSRLDHLEELGVNGIWFMPIHPSQSYHKYDVADYYEIDPAYGTMADMENLLAECEKRGIKVITDLVLNHTGNDHAWFEAAVAYLKDLPAGAEPSAQECKYVDYYYFSKTQGAGYQPIEGTDWFYEGKFSPHMPDLNLANEDVRAEIKDIMQFWFDKGVQGFRLDAVKEFYSGNAPANIEVLAWLWETATSIKADAFLVGEAWEGFGGLTPYYSSGMCSFFDFPFGTSDGKIASVLRGAGTTAVKSYASALEKADQAYLEQNPNYIDAPFLSNHDVGRIAGFVNRDENKIKLAGAMNLFMSGSAFIYYGEEIGMVGSGNDPSKRAPFVWNAARDDGTTDPPPDCQLPEEYPFPSLEEQRTDDSSIYNYYRQAVAIRKAIPAISHGRTTEEKALNAGNISAYRKNWEGEECLILMNIAADPGSVDLSGYEGWTVAATLSANGEPVALEGTTLHMSAFGTAVLVPQG